MPEGITWSAIPVALLCMVVNWNERQGSGPKEDEVLWNTEGLLFVGPFISSSVLDSEKADLRPLAP